MCVLKKTGLQNLYKALTNSFMDEDEEPIIVCFICHARLIRCRTLQQQAIESNAVLEQLLAGGSMSIPKPHEFRDEIQFTSINHIDIWPVECDIENDCNDDIFSLESVKVEEEKIENKNFKTEVNWSHEIDTGEKQEDLEIDAFEDRHEDSENNLPLISLGPKSKTDDVIIEQPCIQTNIFSKPYINKKICPTKKLHRFDQMKHGILPNSLHYIGTVDLVPY
ncbi:unnamed protein product [Parnassius apollo]|uniref:(apollo) hypothetical protein n=1 Tax=Parnassius apollo TaxID=110799 RepID=A0A8S3X3H2_PARAO|nr:unnamed protein product [Parnassius apollo]